LNILDRMQAADFKAFDSPDNGCLNTGQSAQSKRGFGEVEVLFLSASGWLGWYWQKTGLLGMGLACNRVEARPIGKVMSHDGGSA
jgi:hypothetical protein